MRRTALILMAASLLLASSCRPIPEIRQGAGWKGTSHGEVCCRKDCLPYVETPHRLIHAIEARLPDGAVSSLLGVVLVDPVEDTLQCVLMTPEGFVLLDAASRQGTEEVRRAVPPFDSPAVATGMLADIRLLFFPPAGTLQDAGRLENGAAVCRFSDDREGKTDVVAGGDGCWEIRQYGASGFLRRSVRHSGGQRGLFGKSELESPGLMGYSLQMTLLEAEPLR